MKTCLTTALNAAKKTTLKDFLTGACWHEHGACSGLVDDYVPLGKPTSGWHDFITGTEGIGVRPASVGWLNTFTDIPIVGQVYNYGTMFPAWEMTVGSWLGETGLAASAYSGRQVSY